MSNFKNLDLKHKRAIALVSIMLEVMCDRIAEDNGVSKEDVRALYGREACNILKDADNPVQKTEIVASRWDLQLESPKTPEEDIRSRLNFKFFEMSIDQENSQLEIERLLDLCEENEDESNSP